MSIRSASIIKFGFVLAALGVAGLVASAADARPGKSGSLGSRGERTFSAPPTTNTAPKPAAPIEKSMTQPGQAKPSAATAATAGAAQSAARPSMMRNLLLGGLIGAGLATVFGAGAFANVLGFLLQAVLIGGLVYLAVAFFRSRMSGKPAFASAGAGQNPYQAHLDRQAVGAGGGAAVSKTLDITGDDYSAFERLLGEIQGAYGRGDTDALGARATPEMLSYFARELDDNKRNGVTNVLGVPKLLQGDLSEAWREAGGEYATVAMRYSLTDAMVDRAGKVVSGSTTTPDEVTEVWTFRRRAGSGPSGWELSAIQQA